MSTNDETVLDLDAFAPPAGKQIKFRGKLYRVPDMQDIPADDLFLILRAEESFRGKGTEQQIQMGLRFISILAPDMDQETLGRLSQRQLLLIMQQALGAAQIPPTGDGGPSASATTSPSSPDSTAGPGVKSDD